MLLHDFILTVNEYDNFGILSLNYIKDGSLSFVLEKQVGEMKEIIEIVCEGVVNSNISLYWRSISFEGHELTVSNDDALLWKHGYHSKVFCFEPLPNPEGFFCQLSDYLLSLGLQGALFEYLQSPFESWHKRVSHKEFQLLEAPNEVIDYCKKLLQQQGIKFEALRQPHPRDKRNLIVVWIGESWVICESASTKDTTLNIIN